MKKEIICIIACLLLLGTSFAKAQTDITAFVYAKPLFDFDYKKPTFKLEGEQLSNKSRLLRYSIVTGYREGVKPIKGQMGMKFDAYADSNTGTSRIAMINLSLQDMFALNVKPEQVVFEVKDLSKYRYDPKYGNEEQWLRKNGYCYEFVLPMGTFPVGSLFDFIRADIAVQFNLKVVKEKIMTDDQHRYGLTTGATNREVEVFIVSEVK